MNSRHVLTEICRIRFESSRLGHLHRLPVLVVQKLNMWMFRITKSREDVWSLYVKLACSFTFAIESTLSFTKRSNIQKFAERYLLVRLIS